MRVMYEPWFVKYKVDVVFAGHVHAYERSVSIPSTILRSKLIFSFFKSPCIVMIALALLECASEACNFLSSFIFQNDIHLCLWKYEKYFSFLPLLKTTCILKLQERVSNIAYNVVNGLCSPIKDLSAPVYITIGDGGNLEGLATK